VTYRILVTASRDWVNSDLIDFVLGSIARSHSNDVTVIHGNYGNGDLMADAWALHHGLVPERHDADWGKYRRAAGPIRNAEMVQAGADICVAFIKDASRGATGCADLAEAAGIKTIRYRGSDRGLLRGPAGGD
jgi:hypothetical protein